jgi:phospholipase C
VYNATADGESIRAFHLPSTTQHKGVPCQSWHDCHQQWGEGKCDGFVTSAQAVQAQARDGEAADLVDTTPEAATAGMGYWTEQEGREFRRRGDQRGHARCRMAGHTADLGL